MTDHTLGSNALADCDGRPLVTAAVTTYQRPERVRRAIESVLEQTYEPLEVLVVEDGSNSGVEAWLERSGYADAVDFHCHETNRGLAAARNTALDRANGQYVAYLDDDDMWKPERIARQVEHLFNNPAGRRERIGVVYCGLERRQNGSTASILHPENDGSLRDAIVERGPSTVQSSFLFDADALRSVDGFDESLSSSIDHDIWMALAAADYEVLAVDEPLVISVENSDERMTTNTGDRIEGVRAFVEKWQPEYATWTSEAAADRWADRYFARVIARLAAQNTIAGDWLGAHHATRAVFTYSDRQLYNVYVLVRMLAEAAAKQFLPPRVLRLLANSRARLVGAS